ncbi:hypothetical protein [Kingella kingae]|uniref:hypothetical protein n=1 Tax=Kingella kingae TaxID=504 RepID=UPI001E2DB405|nr:hypothetical protein [Kingella kingae]
MKIMKLIKKYGVGATLGAGLMTVATSSFAGPLAEAVASNTTEFKADLYIVGGIVIGLVVVGCGEVVVFRLMRKIYSYWGNHGRISCRRSMLCHFGESVRLQNEHGCPGDFMSWQFKTTRSVFRWQVLRQL